jgi:hypothetical protein
MGAAREAAGSRGKNATNPIEGDRTAPRATTRQGGCQGASRANATRTGGHGTRNTRTATTAIPAVTPPTRQLKVTSAFVMTPFLCNVIFTEKPSNLLELIILAREVATEFDAHHRGMEGFKSTSAKKHVIAFTNWALAIHLGKLKEARVNINPNNNELQSFLAARHNECILPPLKELGTNPFGIARTTNQPRNPNHEVFKSQG